MSSIASRKANAKGPVPNLCLPQPFVTIYIGRGSKLATRAKVKRRLRIKNKDNNGMAVAETQIGPPVIPDPKLPKFLIHKNLICYHSPFFAAAFNGNFIEGTTQAMTLDLDYDDKVAFGVLVNWLYSQLVVTESGRRPCFDTLARVWILAEQFLMPILQNQVMDAIHATLRIYLPSRVAGPIGFIVFAKIAHEHGDGDNQLVEIVVWAMRCSDVTRFNRFVDRLPQEILVKVAQELGKETNPGLDNLAPRKASEFYVPVREERK